MRLIRRGITRTVLLIGPWAIKVPSLRPYGDGLHGVLWSVSRGIQANLSEREWSRNAPNDPVCRVRWSLLGGLVNIYPRCSPVQVGPDGSYPAGPPREWLPLGDDKLENLGMLADRVVWVDYDASYHGCPHDPGGVRRKKADLAADSEIGCG
ncbi:MAG TPA: hypothetical protein VGJ44_19385 [Kribbellaceae bacterium]